jgi:hypothetical protein
MPGKTAVMGVYEHLSEVLAALNALRTEDIAVHEVFSPMRSDKVREALGLPVLAVVRFFTLTGAILGILTGLFLVWYTASQWHFIVGGKPTIPWMPSVIPAFELLILFAVFFNLAGLLIKNGMPRTRLSAHFDPRFSQDRFGIVVKCPEEQMEKVRLIFEQSGAEEVRQIAE